jgi:myo-inositol-1(or 4)-monophosphatase
MKEELIQIARKAGDYLLENFRKDTELIKRRGLSKEVTTKYDLESDRIIVTAIKEKFPDHNILAEESGLHDVQGQYLWIVDSMDGSGNFAMGNPFFSVSIGIMKDDELVLGAIYAPFLDELYVAEKGKGATLNNQPLKVSNQSEITNAYIVACEGGSKSNVRMNKLFNQIYPDVKDMRKLGSAAIEAGFVATGRAESFTTLEISPWDVAAGVLLVQEAGGKVTNFLGEDWKNKKQDLVFSNKIMHEELLKRVRDV